MDIYGADGSLVVYGSRVENPKPPHVHLKAKRDGMLAWDLGRGMVPPLGVESSVKRPYMVIIGRGMVPPLGVESSVKRPYMVIIGRGMVPPLGVESSVKRPYMVIIGRGMVPPLDWRRVPLEQRSGGQELDSFGARLPLLLSFYLCSRGPHDANPHTHRVDGSLRSGYRHPLHTPSHRDTPPDGRQLCPGQLVIITIYGHM
jgi:hypothetical protein